MNVSEVRYVRFYYFYIGFLALYLRYRKLENNTGDTLLSMPPSGLSVFAFDLGALLRVLKHWGLSVLSRVKRNPLTLVVLHGISVLYQNHHILGISCFRSQLGNHRCPTGTQNKRPGLGQIPFLCHCAQAEPSLGSWWTSLSALPASRGQNFNSVSLRYGGVPWLQLALP